MKYLLILPFLLVNALSAAVDYKSYSGYKVIHVGGDDGDLNTLQQKFSTYVSNGLIFFIKYQGGLNSLVSPEFEDQFLKAADELGLEYEVTVEDFSQSIGHERRRRATGFDFTKYNTVADIHEYLNSTALSFPQNTSLILIGQSFEGRDLLGLRINTGNDTKPAFMIESGIHAREWIAPAVAVYFINQLLTSTDADIISLRDQFDWHIVPTVNPDGYQYSMDSDRMWRKTRSQYSSGNSSCFGVDGNRNWDFHWGTAGSSTDPCEYQVYQGPEAFSEIETRSLRDYASNLTNLKIYLTLHSDFEMVLFPNGDSTDHVSNYDDLVQIGTTAIDYGFKVNGTSKFAGPGTAAEVIPSPSSGNGIDYVRDSLGVQLTYTFELRGDNFTWPESKIVSHGDEVTQMILGLATEAKALSYV